MDPIFGIKLSYVIISWNSQKEKKKKKVWPVLSSSSSSSSSSSFPFFKNFLFYFILFFMESTHLLMGHDYLNVREKTYIKQSARRFITDEYEFFIFYKCMYINI